MYYLEEHFQEQPWLNTYEAATCYYRLRSSLGNGSTNYIGSAKVQCKLTLIEH